MTSHVACTALASVQGAPQISTTGTRYGGFTGCATRQRARPGKASVNADAGMLEVELASTVDTDASASILAKISRLISTFSGRLSCT